MRSHFANFLCACLEQRGWTQADLRRALLALELEVTESTLSLWCSGKTIPMLQKLPVIFDALRLDEAERLSGYKAAAGLTLAA